MKILELKRSPILQWTKLKLDKLFYEPPVPPAETQLSKRALELCHVADSYAIGTSGEYKRHQVYASLIKEFPHLPRNEIGLVIE